MLVTGKIKRLFNITREVLELTPVMMPVAHPVGAGWEKHYRCRAASPFQVQEADVSHFLARVDHGGDALLNFQRCSQLLLHMCDSQWSASLLLLRLNRRKPQLRRQFMWHPEGSSCGNAVSREEWVKAYSCKLRNVNVTAKNSCFLLLPLCS